MQVDKSDSLVEDYLEELGRALAGIEARERRELVEDLRDHIRNERAGLDPEANSEAAVRQILDRLGTPATVAAAARAESTPNAARAESTPDAAPAVRQRLTAAQIALIVLAAVLGLVVVLFMVFFAQTSSVHGSVPGSNTTIEVG